MSCCTPRLCGCLPKINDTSVKAPIVVEPDPPPVVEPDPPPVVEPDPPPVVEPDPPSVEMCVTYFFNPYTEQTEERLVPCNELLEVRLE